MNQMKLCMISLGTFLTTAIFSQNLVPNSSMETYSICPNSTDYSVGLATGWMTITNHTGTADYFNVCGDASTDWSNFATNTAVSPHSGNGYIGMITYSAFDQREYAMIQLISPLLAGETYEVSAWVYAATGDYLSDLSSSNIGVFVASSQPTAVACGMCVGVFSAVPQTNSATIISNGWVQITGTFVATGGEQWLALGNFYDNASTLTLANGALNMSGTPSTGYTFFDDVVVQQVIVDPCVTAIDTSSTDETCGLNNGTVTLGAVTGGTPPYQYSFNNQGFSSQTAFTNLEMGTYPIQVEDDLGCIYETSITVGGNNVTGPTDLSIQASEIDCGEENGTIEITSVIGGTAPYLFNFNSTGSTTDMVFENLPIGYYPIIVTDAMGCQYSETASISMTESVESIYIPNCFTPDGDDVNNEWFVTANCVLDFECNIYNRWGNLVKTITNIEETWDGTLEGKKVNDGVYIYIIQIKYASQNSKKYKGHITLIR